MADLTFALTVPRDTDIDSFINFAVTQLRGRYENRRDFIDYFVPPYVNYELTKDGTVYYFNAADLEPAFISVLTEFKKFADFDFTFQLNGKKIDEQNFWRISSDEMFDAGHNYGFEDVDDYGKVYYDAAAARYAADIYFDKLAAFNSKTA